jgi:hypothetical protein
LDKIIEDLSDEEFDKLAHEQHKLYPDLLLCRDYEGIIDDFYDYYKRKR